MSSTGKPTPHLGLNQWLPNDKPERVDFDSDNQKIDAAFSSKANLAGANFVNFLRLNGNDVWDKGNFPIESGTWVPQVKGDATAGTYTFTVVTALYQRIGKMCHIVLALSNGQISSAGSGRLRIGGLPFQSNSYNTIPVGYQFNISKSLILQSFGTEMVGSNATGGVVYVTDLSTGFGIYASGSYLLL